MIAITITRYCYCRVGAGDTKTPKILIERPADPDGFDIMRTLHLNVTKMNKLPPLPGSAPSPTDLGAEMREVPARGAEASPLERQRVKWTPPPLPIVDKHQLSVKNARSPPAKFAEQGFGLPTAHLGSVAKIHLHQCYCEACVEARAYGRSEVKLLYNGS